MHEHPVPAVPKPCDHTFNYCKKCDVVYCEKCKSEWVRKPEFTLRDAQKEYEKIERQRPHPGRMWPPIEKMPVCHVEV